LEIWGQLIQAYTCKSVGYQPRKWKLALLPASILSECEFEIVARIYLLGRENLDN
jgi:hypothetical protein